MAGSLITVSREIPQHKLDLAEVQEVRWERDGIEPVGYYKFFHGNTGQNLNINVANRVHENVANFRNLEVTIRNQELIHEEVKSRLNSVNTCCHSVQNLLSSHLLLKSMKIIIYKTIILAIVFLMGVELCL
jgi:hypothetical protein